MAQQAEQAEQDLRLTRLGVSRLLLVRTFLEQFITQAVVAVAVTIVQVITQAEQAESEAVVAEADNQETANLVLLIQDLVVVAVTTAARLKDQDRLEL